MSNLDVVARLQLRAEQFSSENGRAFAEMRTRAASTAQEVRQSFSSNLAEVQKITANALTMPRTQTGGLNLGAEIAELERLTAAADRNVVAQQQLSVAFTAASASGRGNAEALRQNADAAAVLSLAAEREAASLRERLEGYRQVQVELNRSVGATELHSRVANDNAVSAGQQRAAMQQLGYQVGDVAAQFSAGTPAMIIFAQQGGQVVQALQLMTNRTTGLLGFLGGPWGAVIGAAAVVAGTLAAKLFDSSDAAKAKENAAKSLAAELSGLHDSTMRQVRAEEFFRSATLASASAMLVRVRAERQAIQTRLDTKISEARARRAELDAQISVAGYDESGQGAAIARRASREAQAAAAQERTLLAEKAAQERKAVETQRAAQLIEANARVAESLDKVTAAQGRNRRAIDTLSARYIAGRLTLSEYEAQKRQFDRATENEVAGLRASERSSRGLTEAQKAERAEKRELAQATREAASAQRELDSSYQSIVAALDPALAATSRYRDTLRDIAALSAAGKISEDQADDYRALANRQKEEADARARAEAARGLFGEEPSLVREIDVRELGNQVERAGEMGGYAFARAAEEGLARAVDSIAYLFGGRVSGPLAAVLQPGGIGREAKETSEALVGSVRDLGINLSKDMADTLKAGIETAFRGASFGQVGGSIFSSITGGRENRAASAIGGVVGEIAGKEIGKSVGAGASGLLKTLGGAAGPIGSIVGGIAGSLLGGLFGGKPKPQYGTASLQLVDGAITPGQVTGTSKGGASSLAGSVSKGLQAVVEQLGATITSLPNITVGTYKDQFRVSTTGYTGGPLNFQGKSAKGLFDFGEDQEAAIRFAVSKSLAGAVIEGISDASKRVLQSTDDIDKAVAKALLIEAVPKDLKAMLDPVGAAVDALNTKFQKTVAALKEGGASAEQMAQAQQLYDLQLAQVKSSTQSASEGLKDFLSRLRGGSDSPLSLRDQEAAVRAELAPYLTAIEAGQRVDQSRYQEVAQRFLDVSRELYGSTDQFFAAFDAVQASTAKAIATIDNAVPIGGAVESPFAKATATAAEATANGVQTSNELLTQVSDQLASLSAILAQSGLGGGGAGSSGFVGAGRNFVASF